MSGQTPSTGMEAELNAILASQQVPADMLVTYDEMHGLWGGSMLTVRGDGRLERQTRARGETAPESSGKQIGDRELLELVRLLVELSAWEQHTPDSVPIPDESRAYLTISIRGSTSRMWERFNDMTANDRLTQIKRWMEKQWG